MSPPEFDWRDMATAEDHEARANEHRPTERGVLLREVLRLRAMGLTAGDIAGALRLNVAEVITMLYGRDDSGAA